MLTHLCVGLAALGTLTDKLAAMMMLVQSAPLYRVNTLYSLLNMASKHGRRESLMAIDTLKDLFMTNLLPDKRKLVAFHVRPLSATNITDMHKVYWYFEDILKSIYAEFVSTLSKSSHDAVMHTKRKVQHVCFELLTEKPELEQQLLSLLVNKLGDPERKVASNSAHLLNTLLQRHRGMKLVVVREVETFLHRSSVSPRAQYYGIIFLNQIMLSEEEAEVSKKLLSIYFSMFKRLTDVKEDTSSKMLSALLTGVNRAFPFTPTDSEDFSAQFDILFKIVHVASFNKAAQALQLIYQVMHAHQNLNDRFYRALYQKIASPELYQSSRQALFLNVLYKAMKNDTQLIRVSSFIKRLLQVCHHQSPAFVCGSLFLVSEIVKSKQELTSQFENAVKVSDAIRANSAEVVKRIETEMEQIIAPLASVAAAIPGAELGTGKQSGKIIFGGKERISINSKKGAHANGATPASSITGTTSSGSNKSSSTIVSSEEGESAQSAMKIGEIRLETYDPNARDPLYSHAETSGWWELVSLSKHFHPSVSKWAHAVLANESIEYSGDPLVDFGLQAFLDRIIYKNPKQIQVGNSKNSHAKKSLIPGARTVPINSASFVERPEASVPEDQMFFYKYFQQRVASKPKKDKKDKEVGSDEEDFGSDDDDGGDFGFGDDGDDDLGSGVDDDGSGDDGETMDVDGGDGEFEDDLDEHEVEEALLKGFEKVEGRKLYDRKAMAADEGKTYSYDDLKEEDFDDEEEAGEAMDSFLSTLATADSDSEGETAKSSKKSPKDNTDFMSDNPATKRKAIKALKARGTFADVDEFQHLLETSGVNENENKWEKSRSKKGFSSGGSKNSKKRKAPSMGGRPTQRPTKKPRR